MQRILSIVCFAFVISLFFPSTSFAQSNHTNIHIHVLKKYIVGYRLDRLDKSSVLGIQEAQLDKQRNSLFLAEVNTYRASQGLPSVQSHPEVCAFAKKRAEEIVTNFNHDGFSKRTKDKTLPYTRWSNVTENIAMTTNPEEVVTLWINSPGHAENMRADTPYVCIAQSGNYYAYEGMRE